MTAATNNGGDPLDAILAERWHMASTAAQMFEGDSAPSQVNSEAETDLIEAIRILGTRMIHEVGTDEEADLDALEFTLLGAVEAEMLAWARGVEERRGTRRKAADTVLAEYTLSGARLAALNETGGAA